MTVRCHRIHISNRLDVRNTMVSIFFFSQCSLDKNHFSEKFSLYAGTFSLDETFTAYFFPLAFFARAKRLTFSFTPAVLRQCGCRSTCRSKCQATLQIPYNETFIVNLRHGNTNNNHEEATLHPSMFTATSQHSSNPRYRRAPGRYQHTQSGRRPGLRRHRVPCRGTDSRDT